MVYSDTAAAIVKAAGLSLLQGLMSVTYDELGYRYELPPFVVCEPVKYGEGVLTREQSRDYEETVYRLTLRASGYPDFKLTVSASETVAGLKEAFAQANGVTAQRLRLFVNGREMKSERRVAHYPVSDDIVLMTVLRSDSPRALATY